MMKNRTEPTVAEHQGKLFWASLLKSLPEGLIVPATPDREDPYGFGWEYGPHRAGLRLAFNKIFYATAEAVVALGVIVDSFRRQLPRASLRMECDDSSITNSWVAALRLDQLVDDEWKIVDRGWSNPADCYAYPLRRIHLERVEDTSMRAAALVRTIKLLPEAVLGIEKDDLLASVERVAQEAFLNIFQHAYSEGTARYLYACATVTPARHYIDGKTLEQDFSTPEESRWLCENRDNFMLEIAIADAGLGIPKTLWEDAERRKRAFASSWRLATFNRTTRAEAHQDLCEYAYHHESSRKREQDFVSRPSRLNLRGLHRCQKQTEHLAGCIVIASGQGRAGYAFVDNRMLPISRKGSIRSELPGTMLVLRFSAKPRRNQPLGVRNQKGREPLQIHLGPIVSDEDVRNGLPTEISHELARIEQQPKAIVTYFPFTKFDSVNALLELLAALPAYGVGLLAFAQVPDHVLPELRSDSKDWSMTDGLPRLLGLWNADGRCFVWKLAGHIPTAGQKFCSDLERIGQAHLAEESDEVQGLARDLGKTYRGFLVWDENTKTLEFTGANGLVDAEDFAAVLDKAFDYFLSKTRTEDFVYECSKDEAIRLPTGRLVTRFLSVWNLLRREPVLAAALSQRLLQVLERLGKPSEVCLVAEGPASHAVATLLLRNRANAPKVYTVGQVPRGPVPPRTVIFVDAICRGEGVKRLARELSSKREEGEVLIVCADMRQFKWPLIPETSWRVESLLKLNLTAPDWAGQGDPKKVLEVDAITHVPFGHVCEFAKLAPTPAREELLRNNPDVFHCGFHRVRDFVHSVSLDTAKLVSDHSVKVVSWLADEISSFLKQVLTITPYETKYRNQGFPSLVFFCRSDSHVYRVLHRVAEELPRRMPMVKSVLLAHLTSAPRTPKLVFPRSQENLFADVRDALRQFQLFPIEIPKCFFGVYLDDASITGRTLQDFLSKAATLQMSEPLALLGLLLVNRLSPTEVRFASVCQHLSRRQLGPNTRKNSGSVPFRLASLFRLQIKSMGSSEPGSVFEMIGKLAENSHYFDEPLKGYLSTIRSRMEAAFAPALEREGMNSTVGHPFYPKDPTNRLPSCKSFRAIHIRHLLALNQQNEGVLSDIIKQVNEATIDADFTLLGVFALEPYLLHDEPLATECFPRIRELCISCLRSGAPPQVKSDALAVILQKPEVFLTDLAPVLSLIISNEDLVLQAAAFLLVFLRRDPHHYRLVRKCLDQVNVGSSGHVEWLRTVLDVPQRCDTHHIVSDEAAANVRIHSLVASTWAHIGLTKWQEFDEGMKTMAYKPDAEDGVGPTLGRECLEYAERHLLFGLGGMHCLAQRRLPAEDALAVWTALVDGIRARVEIDQLLNTPCAEQGYEWKARLIDSWNRLRQCTLKGASPVRFLGMVEEISSKPSAIEEFLPRLYSAEPGADTGLSLHAPRDTVAACAVRAWPDHVFLARHG